MGVVSNNWFDRALLSIRCLQTLMLTDVQTPFLGTPSVPLRPSPSANSARQACPADAPALWSPSAPLVVPAQIDAEHAPLGGWGGCRELVLLLWLLRGAAEEFVQASRRARRRGRPRRVALDALAGPAGRLLVRGESQALRGRVGQGLPTL